MMAGSTKNKRDSAGRRLGIKKWGHHAEVFEGDILLKQRGFKWHPGMHVKAGKDHTLHSKVEVSFILTLNCCCLQGQLAFTKDRYSNTKRTRIHMIPMEMPNRRFPVPPPFMYHPELFPELADNNPEPTNFSIPAPQASVAKTMNANTIKQLKVNAIRGVRPFSVVAKGSEDRFETPKDMYSAIF